MVDRSGKSTFDRCGIIPGMHEDAVGGTGYP